MILDFYQKCFGRKISPEALFFEYGFSLFKMSTQRVGILNYNPPASRVVTHCYTQKSPFRTIIEVSSHYLRKER